MFVSEFGLILSGRPMHNPLDMLVFAKVVELKSFSLTARRLGISRSAASKHVSRLEQSLGARLLNRTTRKLSLTEPGHAAYAHCARIAAEVEASELSVQRFVGRPKGLLRVSAPSAFGRLHLAPVLPDYLGRHPDVSIELVLSDRLVDLVEERFDIAIQSSPLTPANLIRRHLAPIRWAVCAAPGYLRRFGAPRHPDDLRRHNCIFYASTAVRGDSWRFSRKGETRLVAVSGNFRANNSELVRDAAARGLGVALLPTFAMWQDIASGALVRVLPDWTPHGTFGTSLTAYFIADRQLTPKIRTLVDFLAERFGRLPAWDRAIAAASPPKPC
jgi:DNA-binding transcriptional LysR family regulator